MSAAITAVERVAGTDGKSYPASYTAHRDAIRKAIESDPSATNTAIAKRVKSSRDTVIAVRREMAGALVDARYEAMCIAIAECYKTDEVKDLRDKALALQVYTRQAKNREAEQHAIDIRMRAERRAGELMLKQAKAEGARGNPGGRGASIVRSNDPTAQPKTLAEQGISKQQASDWQKIATVPKEAFEAALNDPDQPASTASMVRLADKLNPLMSTTAMNGATTMDPLSLWVWGFARDFERKALSAKSPADVFGGMTSSMQADMERLVPAICEWLTGLPFMRVQS
jgi:hypothetical protein